MKNLVINKSITIGKSPSLDIYLREISKIKLLSDDEEIALFQKIQQGDQKALDDLVIANLRFVVSVAKQYQYHGLPLIDLISQGNIGLIKAAHKFDHTRGFKFISFAVDWIRSEIQQEYIIKHKRIVRLPQEKELYISTIRKTIDQLEQTIGTQASYPEILSHINIDMLINYKSGGLDDALHDDHPKTNNSEKHSYDKDTFLYMYNLALGYNALSLDKPSTDSQCNLYNTLLNTNTIEKDHGQSIEMQSEYKALRDILDILFDTREKDILCMYWGIDYDIGYTIDQIADKYHTKYENIRVLIKKCEAKLKKNKSYISSIIYS